MQEILWGLSNLLLTVFALSVVLRCWDLIDYISRGILYAALALSAASIWWGLFV